MAECGNHLFIDLALEGYNEVEDLIHLRPAPLVEFLFVAWRLQIHFAVISCETQGEAGPD